MLTNWTILGVLKLKILAMNDRIQHLQGQIHSENSERGGRDTCPLDKYYSVY